MNHLETVRKVLATGIDERVNAMQRLDEAMGIVSWLRQEMDQKIGAAVPLPQTLMPREPDNILSDLGTDQYPDQSRLIRSRLLTMLNARILYHSPNAPSVSTSDTPPTEPKAPARRREQRVSGIRVVQTPR